MFQGWILLGPQSYLSEQNREEEHLLLMLLVIGIFCEKVKGFCDPNTAELACTCIACSD